MSTKRKLVSFIATISVLAGLFLAVANTQSIYDWWRLRGYDPPAKIAALAERTTLTDEARKVFYVNRPQLLPKAEFNGSCRQEEQSVILGCYRQGDGIYILQVDDKRLQGIHEVTAAHELLHAAYERLDSQEKQKIDALVADYYAKHVKNERIRQAVEQYRKKDPSIVPNELHSILGSEVRILSRELETYYAQYFDNRSEVVEYLDGYEQAFLSIKTQIEAYDSQLTQLRAQIQGAENDLQLQSAALRTERQQLDALRDSGQTEEYNQRVPGYNANVREFNSDLAAAKALIARYNDILQARNALVLEEQELFESIDSRNLPAAQ